RQLGNRHTLIELLTLPVVDDAWGLNADRIGTQADPVLVVLAGNIEVSTQVCRRASVIGDCQLKHCDRIARVAIGSDPALAELRLPEVVNCEFHPGRKSRCTTEVESTGAVIGVRGRASR